MLLHARIPAEVSCLCSLPYGQISGLNVAAAGPSDGRRGFRPELQVERCEIRELVRTEERDAGCGPPALKEVALNDV